MFIDTVDRHTAETIIDHLTTSTAQMAVTQLRVLGGAMARVPVEATAFAHRNRRVLANVAALYGHPDEAAVHEAWVGDFAAALHQGIAGTYVNFLGDEGEARAREAYPGPAWDRLRAIKARYDPTNLFRLNQNIPRRPSVVKRRSLRGPRDLEGSSHFCANQRPGTANALRSTDAQGLGHPLAVGRSAFRQLPMWRILTSFGASPHRPCRVLKEHLLLCRTHQPEELAGLGVIIVVVLPEIPVVGRAFQGERRFGSF